MNIWNEYVLRVAQQVLNAEGSVQSIRVITSPDSPQWQEADAIEVELRKLQHRLIQMIE